MLVFMASAAIGGGANLVCTVLWLSLHSHIGSGRPLGMKLHLQLDNTSAENKNTTVLGFIALLVAWGVFHEASIFFMPVGHTYNELDSAFSPLISAMLQTVVPTISALLNFVETWLVRKNIRLVRNLPHIWDFSSYLEPHMHTIGGFCTTQQSSGMHEFHFTKDPQGVVRMRYRQSSQSSTWAPEGSGDPIFKTVPELSTGPPTAPFKSDLGWRRTDVQVNIRRWLQYLGLGVEQRALAEHEWERVFASMPQDGDINRLSSEQRMQWVALPLARPLPVPQTTGVHAQRDMVENPPVNPVTGAHRRPSVVRAELTEHNNMMRLTNPEPMIFLGDYLFFTLKDTNEVRLGRVTSAPHGGASRSTDVVDVVEYSQVPSLLSHTTSTGFFGKFAPMKNPTYDRTLRGSLAFIRHSDVERDRILVYNVQTFGTSKELHIQLESIRSLARARPSDCAIPQRIPTTHTNRQPEQPAAQHPHGPRPATASPPVANGTRIEIFWTEDPAGWFAGIVTSSRRDGDTWVTRVMYDSSERWRSHAVWHHLNADDDDHVQWRIAPERGTTTTGTTADTAQNDTAPPANILATTMIAPARTNVTQQRRNSRSRMRQAHSSDSADEAESNEDPDLQPQCPHSSTDSSDCERFIRPRQTKKKRFGSGNRRARKH